MKLLLPLILVALPASAQDFGSAVNGAMAQIRMDSQATPAIVKTGANHRRRIAALDETMTGMNDGVEIGGQVVSYVRQNNVEIRFEDQQAVSRIDGKSVVLDWQIAPYPRAIGPRVAWEVSAMMLADMPESAEKEYMRRSIAARVWLELGGEPAKLPVMEPLTGDKDEALAKEMKLWLDGDAQTALYKIGEATRTQSVLVQMDEERDAAKRAALKAANQRFTDFILAENQWRQANPR